MNNKPKFKFYTTDEIKPCGWMKRELEIQRDGLTGNLDKFWPDVMDSKWIGGNREGWERVPYWLDGAVPLAYLLNDADLISRVKKYIDAIIAGQKADGWICPCEDEKRSTYDTWAVELISKVLVRYYECSKDERIPDVIYKCMKNWYSMLKDGSLKLFEWGKFRWFEAFPAINFLYERHKEEWLVDLAKIMKEQGANYPDYTEAWKKPLYKWTFHTHIVNLMQMLKYEALSCGMLGESYNGIGEKLYEELYRYNGTAVGIITGDECLAGISPIQGSELCSVVEQMDSLEQIFAFDGNVHMADLLESVAFNAYPATMSADMWSHQYLQMANQVDCRPMPARSLFGTNYPDSHKFGLEPNYGCCTANMHQGWPKLTLFAFLKGKKEIVNALMIPARLETETYDKAKITIECATEYPFKGKAEFTVSCDRKTDTVFKVRIPGGAKITALKGMTVEGHYAVIKGFEAGVTVLSIEFDFEAKLCRRPGGMFYVRRGPLVFVKHINETWKRDEYERNGVVRKFPYCDYLVSGDGKWNYAFTGAPFEFSYKGISSYPFSGINPPAVLNTKLAPITWEPEFGYEHVCAKKPTDRHRTGPDEDIGLIPYGCARLRMTEMPYVIDR